MATKELEQAQIQFSAQLASLQVKVKALKNLLTGEQLELYAASVLKGKENFLQLHTEVNPETQELIDKFFS